jgi:hypothetical protein
MRMKQERKERKKKNFTREKKKKAGDLDRYIDMRPDVGNGKRQIDTGVPR